MCYKLVDNNNKKILVKKICQLVPVPVPSETRVFKCSVDRSLLIVD